MTSANFAALEMKIYYYTAAMMANKKPKNHKERLHKVQNKVVSLQLGVGAVIPELKLDTISISKFYDMCYSQRRNVNSKVCLKKFVIVVIHKISFTNVA